MRVLVVILLACAAAGAARAEVPTLDQAGEPVVCDVSGATQGVGYTFTVPPSHKGCHIWPRDLYIPLGSKSEDRYILVGWSYNGGALGTLHDWFEDFLADDDERSASVVSGRQSVRLGGLPAERARLDYRDPDTKGAVVLEVIHAMSALTEPNDPDAPMYLYSVELVTTKSHYSQDREQFEKVVRSWHEGPDGR